MAPPKKYPDELRQRAVRLVMDAQKNPADRRRACTRIGAQLGIPADTIRALPRPSWHAQFLAQRSTTPSTTNVVSAHIAETTADGIFSSSMFPVKGIPDWVARARSDIVGHLVLGVCADYERQMDAGPQRADWTGMGNSLMMPRQEC